MLTPTKQWNLPTGLLINEFLLTENNPNKISLPSIRTKELLGITIHNTDDLNNVEDDAEQYTRATYNGNMGTVRASYYNDDLGAWKNLPDDYQNWTNTDGSGPGNAQTITIECIMYSSDLTKEENLKAFYNCAELTAYLLKTYGLNHDDIYTHSHWLHIKDGVTGDRDVLNVTPHSYKTCPLYIIPHWDLFKSVVKEYYDGMTVVLPVETLTVNSTANYQVRVVDPDPNGLNVRDDASFNSNVVTTIKDGVYTIVEEKIVNNFTFGRLKSGVGWIVIKDGLAERV